MGGGGKRTKSGSPSGSGTSTPGTGYPHTRTPSHPGSRSPSAIGGSGTSLPNDTSLSTPQTSLSPLGTKHPITQTITGVSTSARNSTGGAWTGLEKALQALRITTKICPPFASAVDDLVSCLPMFAAAAKNRGDYDDLATGLKAMVDLLIWHLNDTVSKEIIDAITEIAEAIRKEIESINMHQAHSIARRILTEDDLIRRYRRIEQLFCRLQGEASLGAWSGVNELLLEKRLESLSPAKLARFDSELSTEVSRRGCTKDTRTKILEDCMAWSENPVSAKIYWMNGMAGTGKTTIAYSLCERLQAGKQLAASFFCTRLKDKLPNNLVIVVDALDECDDPDTVVLFLDMLFRSAMELPIKFFVTSRPEPAIRNIMMVENERSRSILYLHEVEQSLVQADVELYLREELGSISPTDAYIQELAEHAGNLFIYAATAVRYIRPIGKAVNSKARLAKILAVSAESTKKLSAIDALYSTILTAAADDQELDPEEQANIRLVLWTAVCACEPILIHTLSVLSGLNNKDDTMIALQPLRSILYVSDHSEIVTTLHASFPDYIFNQERSGPFYCDKASHGQLISEQCFKIMRAQLRFNICSIPSSFFPDDEITDLGDRVSANVSEELFYACRFWADHLSETSPLDALLLLAHEFLSQQLLFWMEVLNLKKCIAIGVVSTAKLNTWFTQESVDAPTELLTLASDSYKFVARYAPSPISAYTSHIYMSALPITPPSSSVRSLYFPRFKGLFNISGRALDRLEETAVSTWASIRPIRSAALLPNGDRIALGNDNGTISVHNAYDGKYVVPPFRAHKKVIASIGISSNGMEMVSGSYDMTVSVWRVHDGSLMFGPFRGHTNRVTSVAFSPDATRIVSGSDDCNIAIWTPRNADIPMRALTGHEKGVKTVAFSPDGSRIISGSADRTIRLWDLSNGATILTFRGHRGPVTSVQFSPDGLHIVSGSSDSTLRIWNVSDGSSSHNLVSSYLYHGISSIAVSQDGNTIVCGSLGRMICLWNRHDGKPIARPFKGHTDSVRSVGFSADGTRVTSASKDKTVRVWDVHDRIQKPENISNGTDKLIAVLVSSVDQSRVALYTEFRICIWDLRTLACVVIQSSDAWFRNVQFSNDGSCIHSLDVNGTICTWDAQTAELLGGPHRYSTYPPFHGGWVTCSADGTRVVTCDNTDNKAELWHVHSNRSIAFCEGQANTRDHPGKPYAIFSQDGRQVHSYENYRSTPSGADYDRKTLARWIWNIRDENVTTILAQTEADMVYVKELRYSSDGWFLLVREHDKDRGDIYIQRLHINYPPFETRSDGWILDYKHQPLLWLPSEIQKDITGCNSVIISGSGHDIVQFVDYGDMLVGDDWSGCYVNTNSSQDVIT
ncbi:hypothetical protein OPQ81_008020 [Rhizoctonia solani]|nr:hypothetical protein OPQ81_008020 [Rhizoctonia solani]